MKHIKAYRRNSSAGTGNGTGGNGSFAPNCYVAGYEPLWSYVSGLSILVTPKQLPYIRFHLNGVLVDSSGGSTTLSAADGTNDRFDAIVINSSGTVTNITGTAAANPALPDVDPTTYKLVTYIRVTANATDLVDDDLNSFCPYKEDAGTAGGEWDFTTTQGGFVTLDDTNNPNNGTKAIRVAPSFSAGELATGVGSTAISRNDYDRLRFYTTTAGTSSTNAQRYLTISLKNGNSNVASITISNGNYGWDPNSSSYHAVVIPLDDFTWFGNKTEFDTIVFTASTWEHVAGQNIDIDDICFQGNLISADPDCCTPKVQTLYEETNTDWDASLGESAILTLTGDSTLQVPTNIQPGMTLVLKVIQDGTGGHTLSFATGYFISGSQTYPSANAANQVDIITFWIDDSLNIYLVATEAFAAV